MGLFFNTSIYLLGYFYLLKCLSPTRLHAQSCLKVGVSRKEAFSDFSLLQVISA